MSFAATLRRSRNNNRVRHAHAVFGTPVRCRRASGSSDDRGHGRSGGGSAGGGSGRLRPKLGNAGVLLPGGSGRALPPLPAPRAAGGAAVVRGRLYVAGGVGPVGLARQTFVFDLRRCRWSSLPGPTPREHLAVTAARGRLYALAGRKAGFDANTTIFESLAPPARRWRGLPPVPAARGGTGAATPGLATSGTNEFLPLR